MEFRTNSTKLMPMLAFNPPFRAYKHVVNQEIAEVQSKSYSVPKSPESFSYDADGNLTSDGRFTDSWDAENRLIAVESNVGIPARVKLEFAYDYMGRRIFKKVYSRATDHWVLDKTEKFALNIWNVIAVFQSLLSSPFTLHASYLWGEDLSGILRRRRWRSAGSY